MSDVFGYVFPCCEAKDIHDPGCAYLWSIERDAKLEET